MDRRFAVIGAGPAGLTAALKILKDIPNSLVDVYEETKRTGGISTTIEYKGNRIDIGGHRFFSKNKEVNDFWFSLMPVQKETEPETDIVMLIRNRVSRIFYRRKFFDYPISLKLRTFLNMGFLNTILAGFSFLFSSFFKRKEKSLEDFYINRFGRHLYRMFFEDYTKKVWGVHPSNLSAAWGAQRIKNLSVTAIIKEAIAKFFNSNYKTKQTSLIEQFHYPKLGPGQLWLIAAEKIIEAGGKIHYGQKVTGLKLEKKCISGIKTNNNEIIPYDIVLSTMPVKDLIRAINSGNGEKAPEEISKITDELPYRDFITVGLLLNKLKLKKDKFNNIIPDCWIYIQERDVYLGRLQIFNNWSPYMVKDPVNTVWIGLEYFCNEGDYLWNMNQEDFIKFAIDELVKIKIIDKEDVLDATHVKIEKAYPAYFGSYSEMDTVREYLNSIQNLYCLGRNGQHKYNNMDHSMLTAMEAVKLIKDGNTDKSAVWNVNTEGEYHEEKHN